MMMAPLFLLLVIAMTTLPPFINGLVPPKTPVLSGFEPAAVGSNRELVCDASQPGAGPITYEWYKYSTDKGVEDWETKGNISTNQKYVFSPVTDRKVFHPGGMAEPVSGKYKCRASNSAGTRDSEWGDLYVYEPCSLYTVSVFPAKPAIGSKFTLNCDIPNQSGYAVNWIKKADTSSQATNVALANSKGCHAPDNPRYSWSSCSPPSISSPTRTFNLQVTNAQPLDSAYWICKDINLSCDSDPIKQVVQAIPGKPQITGFPSGPVTAGTQLNLKCDASPTGDTYDWYKDGTKVSTSLTYDFDVAKESAGVYRCEARNAAGSATSSDKKTLKVYYKPDSVVVSSGKTSSHVNETDKFTCTVSGGKPTPTVKLYFKRLGGTPVEVTQGQDRVMAKEDNQAEYYCEAKVTGYPALDMTSSRKTYNVTFSSTKVSFLNNLTAAVQAGQVKKFTCETDESNPITHIKWYQYIGSSWQDDITTGVSSSERNGTHGGKIRISELSVTATKAMNGATVRCRSTYSLTGHEFTVQAYATMYVKWSATELKMVQKPSVPITAGVGVTTKCETDSSNSGSPGTISWYGNGKLNTTGVTPSTRQASDKGTIYVSELNFTAKKEDNQAKYECKINDQANFRKDVTITVYFPPNGIQLSETSITVKEGVTKTITCSTTSSSNPAVSGVSVKKLGSSEVNVTGTSRETNGTYYGKDVSIDITLDTNRKDNGAQYICSFTYGSTTLTKTATVNVQFNPSKITMTQEPSTAVHEGKSFTITCETDSANPVADITFHRNRTVGTWEQLTSGVTSENRAGEYNGRIRKSSLTVTANRSDNQAIFKCKMMNGLFLIEQNVTVNVYFPPDGIQLSETSITVKEGVTKTITCSTTSSSNPAVSSISVKKRLGSSDVDVAGTSRVTDGTYYGKDVSIDIKLDTNRKDNGAQYICSLNASTHFTKTANVSVQFNPSKIMMTQKPPTSINEGKSFTIICETDSANPVADIQFHRNRTGGTWELLTSGIASEVRAGEYNGSIRKSTFTGTANRSDNQAVFKCEVKNGSFQVEQTKTVNVYFPPTVKMSSSPKSAKEGDTLTLTCTATGGNPTSYTYKWFYENMEIPNETSKDYNITSIRYTQSGTYRCQATNYSPDGNASGSLNVDVLYKAKWNPGYPELFTVASKTNSPMKFVLHVIANPRPTNVSWFLWNKTAITNNITFIAAKVNDKTYTLNKTSVEVDDYGNYTVNVTNDVGFSTFTFVLQAEEHPHTPCCLGLVNATAVSVILSFARKFNGGSLQTFTIEKRTPKGDVWKIAVTGIADPGVGKIVTQKISDLDSGVNYKFRVKATNAFGDSDYGEIFEAKTEAAPNVIITVKRKDNMVTVSWPKLLKEYTKIQVKYCPKEGGSCDYHNVTDPTSLKSSFTVKDDGTYMYSMIIFDGEDQVFVSPPVPAALGLPIGAIAGGVGGFIFFLIIIAVVLAVVFIMKRRRAEKDSGILKSNNNGDANGGQVNPGFSDLDARHSDVTDGLNQYDESMEMTAPPSSIQTVTGGAEYAVVNKKGSKKPLVGEAYAEVDLKKKKGGKKGSAPPQPGQAYAEVDFSKKSKGKKGKDETLVPSANPGGQAYAEVDFTKKSKKGEAPTAPAGPGDVYAEVSKPKKPSKPSKPGKPGSDDQAVYANVPNGDVDEENLYEDVRKEEPTENGYRQPIKAYQVGVDGTIYSQVQISPPKNPDEIRGKETIEEYASVDFTLQAPPLPEPEDPDDPNDPSFMVLIE